MPDLNLADAFEAIAAVRGDEDAIVQGDSVVSWNQLDARADSLASWMLDQGAERQGKVAVYTYNHPAYIESVVAAFKASLAPVNVNYRYREGELAYLFDNADTEIIVVHEDFAPLLAKVAGDISTLRGILVISSASGAQADVSSLDALPVAVEDFETVASGARTLPAVERSADDLLIIYTGGTTGMPKGVMWRQGDLYAKLGGAGAGPSPETIEELAEYVKEPPLRYRTLVGPPLMHGTGWFMSIVAHLTGGSVILLPTATKFEPAELWETVERDKPNICAIVGDSFAKPLLRELDSETREYDLSSLAIIASSGVMWSKETKEGLLAHHPGLILMDVFSSSEAIGTGMSITTAGSTVETAKFTLSETTRLFDADLNPIETGPGAKGIVGVGGNQPIGYYKDEAKTAATFTQLDGMQFSVPGDWAEVEDDGVTLHLLGRGSVCINTGGEKVFPEEVEEAVKQSGLVADVVVVGIADDKWGEAITAVVSPLPGNQVSTVDVDAITTYVKDRLAAYKTPKNVVVIEEVFRSPSGKADYKKTRETAIAELGLDG